MLAHRFPSLVVEHPRVLWLSVEKTIFEDVAEIAWALETLGKREWVQFNSSLTIEGLRLYRCRLEYELLEKGFEPDVEFPEFEHPLPKYWRQVESLVDLHALSIEMDNCIMMYQPNLTAGQAFLFVNRITFEDPCCCLVFQAGDHLRLHDFGFPKNRCIQEAERLAVLHDFEGLSIKTSA